MKMTIEEERFGPLGGRTIDACVVCGNDVTQADLFCVRVDLPGGIPGRFHDPCFRAYVGGLQLFAAMVMRSDPEDVIH